MQFREFFPQNGTNTTYFYAFHHPIYQYINYFDLINIFSSPQVMKAFLKKNMAFTSSLLEHNHKDRDVMGESQMMKHKMVVPKVIKCYFSRNFAYIL